MPNPQNKVTLTASLLRVDGITHTKEVINNKARSQSLSLGQPLNGNIFAILYLLYFQFTKAIYSENNLPDEHFNREAVMVLCTNMFLMRLKF
jgi:hypothetical protein